MRKNNVVNFPNKRKKIISKLSSISSSKIQKNLNRDYKKEFNEMVLHNKPVFEDDWSDCVMVVDIGHYTECDPPTEEEVRKAVETLENSDLSITFKTKSDMVQMLNARSFTQLAELRSINGMNIILDQYLRKAGLI